MAKLKISDFDTNPDNNTDINSINIAEGCAPSGINNAIRQLMSDLKEFQTGAGGDPFNGAVNGTVGATTPNTGAFTTLSASGAFSANGGATLGDASGDALTINSSAVSIPNGLNFGSNNLVLSSGNVGIGTSSPASGVKLDVNGKTKSTSLDIGTTAGQTLDLFKIGSDNYIWCANSAPILFGTNNAERMRIDSSGNLLVGTTNTSGTAGVGLKYIHSATTPALKIVTGVANTDAPIQVYSTSSSSFPFYVQTDGIAYVGKGIQFPATQSASSDANTLDDYEEGTWTPTNAGGMTGFSAINGTYIKIGRLVNIRCAFSITGVTTNMTLSGLPFAAATTYYSVVYSGINVSIAFSFVRTDSSIEWNVNTTGGGNQTINMTAWYQV